MYKKTNAIQVPQLVKCPFQVYAKHRTNFRAIRHGQLLYLMYGDDVTTKDEEHVLALTERPVPPHHHQFHPLNNSPMPRVQPPLPPPETRACTLRMVRWEVNKAENTPAFTVNIPTLPSVETTMVATRTIGHL